jgi:1,4-alpha-glucan branching enzyme
LGQHPPPRAGAHPGTGRPLTPPENERDRTSFPPTLDQRDLQLFAQGNHGRLYEKLGAHPRTLEGVDGVSFAVWAPAARAVSVVENGVTHPMRRLDPAGVWEGFLPHASTGLHYTYEVTTASDDKVIKSDPFSFATEGPPGTASVVFAPQYRFTDEGWMLKRASSVPASSPLSIYEVHLGSWRRHNDRRPFSYTELATSLPAYVRDMGFTHVEFLPVAEHPFGGSWGYQITNYFAPTARFGTPDEFSELVDALHAAGVGVIIDWVPAHFPKDGWALARFDGAALYEDADPQRGQHPDWGTLIFDYARPEVRNFLISNVLFWAERFHIDGFRVDAVASMLYLDYSRKEGEWTPNRHGGRENLEAVAFIRELTTKVHTEHPDVLIIAEESGAWPGVTRPVPDGGLGFNFKWNLGWMHDTLEHFEREPERRGDHQKDLTFTLMYAWSERYVLPLSHDEVVHEKRSLVSKMSGDVNERLASLRSLFAYMWAYPGKQLLFMGGEIAQEREWNHDASIDWELLNDPSRAGVQTLVRDLNHFYVRLPELWQHDDSPEAFHWTAQAEARSGIASFVRTDPGGSLICVCNLGPAMWGGFRIGVPFAGRVEELLNTDASIYGGAARTNPVATVTSEPAQGFPYSTVVTLAPSTTLWLHNSKPEGPQHP